MGKYEFIETLFRKYLKDNCSREEMEVLEALLAKSDSQAFFRLLLLKEMQKAGIKDEPGNEEEKNILLEIFEKIKKQLPD